MKKTGFVALLATAALALSACGGSGSSSSDGSTKSKETTKSKGADYLKANYDDLKEGGKLNLSIGELAEQSNPFHQDASAYVTRLWYWYNPQLALFDDDGTWHYNPDYFDDVKAEEVGGNTVLTYKIKDEATFNDGTPIDYRAFETTWMTNNGKDIKAFPASSTDGYERIESVAPGANDKEVVVTFDGIYAWWQGLFNMVLHPTINTSDAYIHKYSNNLNPDLGAGPYKVETYDQAGGRVSFVPNEKWWGPKGKLESVNYKVMDPQAELNAFLNGEIDVISAASAERYTAVKDKTGVTIYNTFIPSNALFMLNAKNAVLSDEKVRKAIFEAIDRESIQKVVFQGTEYTENLPGSFSLFESQKGYEDNFGKVVRYDAEAAKKGFEEAGWVAGADGIREKDGQKLSLRFVLVGNSATAKNRASAIQQMMKNVGVDLQIEERPASEFSKIVTSRDFDAMVMGFTSTDPFGVAYFGQIYSSDSGLNRSGTGSPEFDKKIDELQKIGNPDEQIKKANELETEAFKFYGIMPLYNGPGKSAVKEGLANFSGDIGDGAMGFAIKAKEDIGWVK